MLTTVWVSVRNVALWTWGVEPEHVDTDEGWVESDVYWANAVRAVGPVWAALTPLSSLLLTVPLQRLRSVAGRVGYLLSALVVWRVLWVPLLGGAVERQLLIRERERDDQQSHTHLGISGVMSEHEGRGR